VPFRCSTTTRLDFITPYPPDSFYLDATKSIALKMLEHPSAIVEMVYLASPSPPSSPSKASPHDPNRILANTEDALVSHGISRSQLRSVVKTAPTPTARPSVFFRTVQEIRVDGRIDFRPCSADLDLSPSSATSTLLSQLTSFLTVAPLLSITIEGHSDTKPQPFGTNLSLSQERADAVAAHLSSSSSIAASRLVTLGYGDQRLLVDTRSSVELDVRENNARNRRVVFCLSSEATEKSIHALASASLNKSAVSRLLSTARNAIYDTPLREAAAAVLLQKNYNWACFRLLHVAVRKNDPRNCPIARLNDDCLFSILVKYITLCGD